MSDIRAWWAHRQGLDGTMAKCGPADVLAGAGWARSVGGANPYLSLWARAGSTRSEVDAAMADLELYELPAARGCTYVVPRAHFALALQVGRNEAEIQTLGKLGVTRAEVDSLCTAVLEVVGDEPIDPAQLKTVLGDKVRNLGDEGRRRGATTTLPAVLGFLQGKGQLRRVPRNGRLDQQQYGYVRWDAPDTGLTDEAARAELARLYFQWTGPASVAHFRWFSGLSAAAAKAAVAGLELVDVGDGLLPADLVDEYRDFQSPTTPTYRLLANFDAVVLLRRDHQALIDGEVVLPGGEPVTGATYLADHPIVDRGRIVGLWQYDPDTEKVVWWAFEPPEDLDALRAAVTETETFVRDHLGDVRSGGLDSPKSRQGRLATLSSWRS
ncbi:DNA glycosylase AlkZ-like family protein [Actinocrispum wychmicini]|uniref:Winged helix DNA-binding protein n=1 Tax=Actinocrispum wychmicini TaxID=1213861 RepID=A0A4V2S897_9PSEU|nr:crosslink repair DNA glycosylase YcaQ family protein [Actinocrispum wychmicini]TCO62800.1 winged helix DNA-binding protein [Actinocrispum wychmicini]